MLDANTGLGIHAGAGGVQVAGGSAEGGLAEHATSHAPEVRTIVRKDGMAAVNVRPRAAG
jgi:hypothetical protein